MSQAGIIALSSTPSVPTTFNADSGSATPAANILSIVGINGVTTSGTGSTITIDGSGTGGTTFDDSTFRIYDNGDNSKEVAFEVSGVTTGTTRTLTIPDSSGTVALVEDFIDSVFRIYDDGDVTKELAFEVSAINPSTTRTITVPDQNVNLTPDSTFQQTISGATISSATVATGDKVLIQDIDDSDNLKYVTAQSIADLASTTEFLDSTFRILDNGDNTKEIAFQASGITTSTTRTITMADQDVSLVPDSTFQQTISGATISSATVATGDKVLIQDVDDSDNLKYVTAQSIADLGGGGISTPGTTTDNALVRWDGTDGTAIQNSGYLYGDAPAGYTGSEERHIKSVVQTTDDTTTDLVQIAVAEDQLVIIESRIGVIESDYSTFDGFRVFCTFKRETGGNVALVGTEVIDSSAGTYTVSVTADTGNQEATIQVTGATSQTLNWVAHTTYHFINNNS